MGTIDWASLSVKRMLDIVSKLFGVSISRTSRICWVLCLFPCVALWGDDYTDGEKLFTLKVKPMLKQKCFSCHGGEERIKGDLILTNLEDMLMGGETSEDVLIPGNGRESLLYLSTTREIEDYEMPPKESESLSQEETWMIRDWIDAGAPWPSDEAQKDIAAKYAEGVIVTTIGGLDDDWTFRRYEEENLWAYQPIQDPKQPEGYETSHPVDAFIERKLEDYGLEAAALADRRRLIRRATFDLIGLPPTPEEVNAFLRDSRSEEKAFAAVVDRLLADPRYGEQWGRHWLDVVRYADTAGFANDYERPNAWRYRDYVIRSFNEDKPFDEFVKEQVAGDESDPENPDAIFATGFLRMGPWENTSMTVARITRQQFLDDVTDSVGQVFMSHPLQCARCHDHKFDPIPTEDYYRIQAVFAATHFADREVPFQDYEALIGFDEKETMEKRIEYFDKMNRDLTQKNDAAAKRWALERGLPEGNRKQLARLGVPDEQLPPTGLGLSDEEVGIQNVGRKNAKHGKYELNKFEPFALSVYSGNAPEKPTMSGAMVALPEDPMAQGEMEKAHIRVGGDPFAAGPEVSPGTLSVVSLQQEGGHSDIPEDPKGRRLAFAEWLVDPSNTLVARSMANRIWTYHFNQGIVNTPNNFGAMGGKPTHPELLDFLASRFMESGWSIKAMHRLIMSSETYRRSSEYGDRERLDEKDSKGTSYAVFQPRRLSAEEIRDSMLYVSGELSASMGGLPSRPEINRDVALQPRRIMGTYAAAYEPARTPEQRNRRSVYIKRIRGLRNPFMDVFNQPSLDESCALRSSSTVTPQVFSLFNGEDSLLRSIATAKSLLEKHKKRSSVVSELFHRAYGRRPQSKEMKLSLGHWKDLEKRHETLSFEAREFPRLVERFAVEEMNGAPFSFIEELFGYENYVPDPGLAEVDAETRALAHLCLVLFNSNEFLYVY